MTATQSKADLRTAALAKRDALSDEQRAAAAQAMAKHTIPFAILPRMIVSGYSPIRSEIDPAPLMRKLAEQGAKLALPAVTASEPPTASNLAPATLSFTPIPAIATRLGISEQAARARVSRGLRALGRALEPRLAQEHPR